MEATEMRNEELEIRNEKVNAMKTQKSKCNSTRSSD
jgi:hypothetical protein